MTDSRIKEIEARFPENERKLASYVVANSRDPLVMTQIVSDIDYLLKRISSLEAIRAAAEDFSRAWAKGDDLVTPRRSLYAALAACGETNEPNR